VLPGVDDASCEKEPECVGWCMGCEVAPEATEAYDKRRGTLPPNWLGRLPLPDPVPSVMLVRRTKLAQLLHTNTEQSA
jgi:hypothetical protein